MCVSQVQADAVYRSGLAAVQAPAYCKLYMLAECCSGAQLTCHDTQLDCCQWIMPCNCTACKPASQPSQICLEVHCSEPLPAP